LAAWHGPPAGHRLRGGPAEFAVVAHGPDDTAPAEAMTARIEAWQSAGRPSPQLTALPAGTSGTDLPPGDVVDKRHSRLVISWSAPIIKTPISLVSSA
jgi:protein-L-isoaspartate(D-aspartate) O-methyltransferase